VPLSTEIDRELMQRLASRERGALGELFDRHGSAVLGLLIRLLRRREEAEELMQEVFLQAWNRAESYRPEASAPRSWLLMIARSRAIDQIRSRAARRRREQEVGEAAELNGHPIALPEGLDRLERSERKRLVARALGGLGEDQRTAIELAFFGGLSHREVAEKLDAPLGTVKSRILLGMKKLRRSLAESAA
jgi:RNA polymerase sigma-70 factor (ECF subfamily)